MGKKILVVDDEPGYVDLLRDMLVSKGYVVPTAYDGREAIAKVESEKPDLIILDIKMPKISGYEVCRLLRDDKRFKDIPVIMLTALRELEDVKTGMSLGAVSFVSKPFEQHTLLAMIHGLIGPAATQPSEDAS